MEPDHAEALAARGEAELWRSMIGNEVDMPDLVAAAEARAGLALANDGECWRAQIVLGACIAAGGNGAKRRSISQRRSEALRIARSFIPGMPDS
jgi:hypothetical protein